MALVFSYFLFYFVDLTDDPDSNIQSPPVVQTKQPIKSDEKTGLTPKLVQVLINKRDYLRLQVKSFQKSFPGFRFSRFSKEKPVLIDENVDVPKPCDAVASNTDCLESSFDGGHVMAVLRGEGHSDNQVAPSTSGSAMATSEKNAVATSLEKLVTSLQKKGSDVQTATGRFTHQSQVVLGIKQVVLGIKQVVLGIKQSQVGLIINHR